MAYTLKEFAKMFSVSEHTVRYYTDINILPCERDKRDRRIFTEESINWMQGIECLKGSGASIEVIKKYGDLCRIPESRESLEQRYKIMLEQREEAYKRLEEAKATVAYMDEKVKHYEKILSGDIPDDSNPEEWTADTRPKKH